MKNSSHTQSVKYGRQGHRVMLQNTSKQQRRAWARKGGEATRRLWAKINRELK